MKLISVLITTPCFIEKRHRLDTGVLCEDKELKEQ